MKKVAILTVFAAACWAAAPDRAPKPDEWGYRPADKSTVATNPPNFSWVSDKVGTKFTLQWSQSADFSKATTVDNIPWSVYTHNKPFAAGTYYWRYKIAGAPEWSSIRSVVVPANAVVFPQPTFEELKARIPKEHPRLFLTPADLPRLRAFAKGAGAAAFQKLLARADRLLKSEPTPEPTEMGTISNPKMVQYWWSNRVQTLKACNEAEVLSFAYLMTEDPKYKEGARKWILHLAKWNPDGPTNWKLNDEAAMPILHRLARAYDWGYGALTEAERAQVRAVMARRAQDAWKTGGQIKEGAGHLDQPFNSHGNRAWHKLAETAIATLGDTAESDQYLNYAVTKFFNAYPVWSDDDGGWHEGLSYWAGYMVKAAWWMDLCRSTLGIDAFQKPFFSNFADYAMYTAPPGSPNGGFGDLSSHGASTGWSFVHFFAANAHNPYWEWWAQQNRIKDESDEPVLSFLWTGGAKVEAKSPAGVLPVSKVFHGTGLAILNTTLENSKDNVQVRFKSSPMGRQSHGHDPHNSFTLNAYGDALLTNNVYRDLYGSPFHKNWVWTTRAQNALLINGEGQRIHSANPDGKIVAEQLMDGLDYVAGDATAAYEGKVTSYLRHVIFLKPDILIVSDEVQAPEASKFQLMLHSDVPFEVSEDKQRVMVEREKAGVLVDFVVPDQKLAFKQWEGYEPPPNKPMPKQWHLEAGTGAMRDRVVLISVMRTYRKGHRPTGEVRLESDGRTFHVEDAVFTFQGKTIAVQRGGKSWTLNLARR